MHYWTIETVWDTVFWLGIAASSSTGSRTRTSGSGILVKRSILSTVEPMERLPSTSGNHARHGTGKVWFLKIQKTWISGMLSDWRTYRLHYHPDKLYSSRLLELLPTIHTVAGRTPKMSQLSKCMQP